MSDLEKRVEQLEETVAVLTDQLRRLNLPIIQVSSKACHYCNPNWGNTRASQYQFERIEKCSNCGASKEYQKIENGYSMVLLDPMGIPVS